ncbi:heterogeneous nuclear ribonucleoprotein C-like isoform X2 [Acanthaster planci]|uniref:Heterogeneous nuclear ribonucleoprotein C-like isoform X2 n=1 Tax=Acanthaster planci TaxID=133434 RepID=A0A8B7YKC2_ACAPL|nr:heterogeneous nuclear ribonucleoprotein C-like isoform X2 [Acanthaster planci]
MNNMFGGQHPGGFGYSQHGGFGNPQGAGPQFTGGGGGAHGPHGPGTGMVDHTNRYAGLTPGISNVTNRNDMKSRASRVFIGNLNTGLVMAKEIESRFCKYGHITGISIHEGYGFVQYSNELNARQAIEGEYGAVLCRQPIDVRIASEPNPNRPKGFKRVQGNVTGGYVDPATLPVIVPSGPPAAKKQKTFTGKKAQQFTGQEPPIWMCAYCKVHVDSCWGLMRHVAREHQTQIYMDDI